MFPRTRTVVDMGGQDTKAIRVSPAGEIVDFCMNDKCAAGTGKFIEVTSHALGLKLKDFSKLYFESDSTCSISSTCTVFAESEIISLAAQKRKSKDIAAGLIQNMAKRIANTAKGLKIKPEAAFTGGVAKNKGMRAALEKELNIKFADFDFDPQLVGALGAALIAAKSK